MIVVIGSPIAQPAGRAIDAGGLGAAIARAAAADGAAVQVVGRVGDDAAGDAVLLALAAAGVDHVAVLREAGRPTPSAPPRDGGSPSPDGPALGEALAMDADDAAGTIEPAGLSVDAADLELALRYVPDYRVVIVAADLDPAATAAVTAASSWAGARLIALVGGDGGADGLPAEATILARPAVDEDGAFATLVAGFAVALDHGAEPADAFAAAQRAAGWAAVVD